VTDDTGRHRPHEHHPFGRRTVLPRVDAPAIDRAVGRRSVLAGGMGGLLLAALPPGAAASARTSLTAAAAAGEPTATGAARTSALFPGVTLVHGDLHNHTLLSDGDGDPALAFESMRDAGLDVAALTDHTVVPQEFRDALEDVLPPETEPFLGLDDAEWSLTGRLADAADAPGAFTAIRGFEWSAPFAGHVNVWFTRRYRALTLVDAGRMDGLYRWLARPDRWWLEGGADGVFGFNHPGREPGRFQEFRPEPGLVDRMVSLELFNRRDDYLFRGVAQGRTSPLVACLRAGWRPGLLGVTDEHGTDWGLPEGKGRAGLWVTANTRAGVREAMTARRFFATRESGLRVAATADGVPYGGPVSVARGEVVVDLDVDRGPAWQGRPLAAQVLADGPVVPEVLAVEPVTCGVPARFRVPVDAASARWLVVRVADPAEPSDAPGPPGHPADNRAVAYTSPWYLG
jgi:hypothetical protein